MKATIELDLDNETDILRFQMMEKADSIYFAIRSFYEESRIDQTTRNLLFEKMADQKDGLIDIFFPD